MAESISTTDIYETVALTTNQEKIVIKIQNRGITT